MTEPRGKGRNGLRWWRKGERPRELCDRRFDWAYIYVAVRRATGEDVCLVMSEVSASAMSTFLAALAEALLAQPACRAGAIDQAGWYGAEALAIPGLITLVPLLPYRCLVPAFGGAGRE